MRKKIPVICQINNHNLSLNRPYTWDIHTSDSRVSHIIINESQSIFSGKITLFHISLTTA